MQLIASAPPAADGGALLTTLPTAAVAVAASAAAAGTADELCTAAGPPEDASAMRRSTLPMASTMVLDMPPRPDQCGLPLAAAAAAAAAMFLATACTDENRCESAFIHGFIAGNYAVCQQIQAIARGYFFACCRNADCTFCLGLMVLRKRSGGGATDGAHGSCARRDRGGQCFMHPPRISRHGKGVIDIGTTLPYLWALQRGLCA